MISRPGKNEYAEFYEKYINQVTGDNVIDEMEKQQKTLMGIFTPITEEKSNYRYAEDKWNIKEVVGHILDGERVFAYRALRISRNDEQPLAGFDQNEYIKFSNYKNISFEKIIDEFFLLRASNILMFKGFSHDMWLKNGIASGNSVSVRALAYIITGHVEHHINILKEKYNC